MSEEKRLDNFELDMEELEAVAGGKIDPEVAEKLRGQINEKIMAQRKELEDKIKELQKEMAKNTLNIWKDFQKFKNDNQDVTEETLKKHFEEKYGITW